MPVLKIAIRLLKGRYTGKIMVYGNRSLRFLATLGCLASAVASHAQFNFQAFLNGSNEVPPNASPGTAFATVTLNAAETQIGVIMDMMSLTAPATAAHIHLAPVGVNGPIQITLTGFPNSASGGYAGSFAVTPTDVANLRSGNWYFNVHTNTFPSGEIRGQIQAVPEPATLCALGLGAVALMRRRKVRAV
jgi:hypothetical protein